MHICIDANFIGGAVGEVFFSDDLTIHFSAPNNGSPKSLWYYFRISGAKGLNLRICQEDLQSVLGFDESRGYGLTCPVVKQGELGTWKRIPYGKVKYQIEPLKYEFSVLADEDVLYVAFSFPYLLDDFLQFLGGLDRYRQFFTLKYLQNTQEGRPYPILQVSDGSSRRHKVVIISARHHAGEVSGSFVLEGILRSVLEGLATSDPQFQDIMLVVIPFVDLDGVQTGRYGKDRPPIDFNRDWSANPKHLEIRLLREMEELLATQHDFSLYIDLHAPQPGGSTYIVPARAALYQKPVYCSLWSYYQVFEEMVETFTTCRVTDLDSNAINWAKAAYQNNSVAYHARMYNIPAFTLETTYHFDSRNQLLGPKSWCLLGASLIQSAYTHLVIESEDKPKEELPSGEMLWDFWEMVMLPRNSTVLPTHDAMTISSKGAGSAFITYKHYFKQHENVCINIYPKITLFPWQLETIVYYYFDGCVLDRFGYEYHILENHPVTIQPRHGIDEPYDSFRVSLRFRQLEGSVLVKVENNGID